MLFSNQISLRGVAILVPDRGLFRAALRHLSAMSAPRFARIAPSKVSVMELQEAFESIFVQLGTRDCKAIFQEQLCCILQESQSRNHFQFDLRSRISIQESLSIPSTISESEACVTNNPQEIDEALTWKCNPDVALMAKHHVVALEFIRKAFLFVPKRFFECPPVISRMTMSDVSLRRKTPAWPTAR